MMQYVIIVALIAFIYFFYIKKKPSKVSTQTKNKKSEQKANDMVECETCHVYAQLDECIISNGKYYCSQECVEKAR